VPSAISSRLVSGAAEAEAEAVTRHPSSLASRTILGTLVNPILDRLDLRGGCVRAPERHLGISSERSGEYPNQISLRSFSICNHGGIDQSILSFWKAYDGISQRIRCVPSESVASMFGFQSRWIFAGHELVKDGLNLGESSHSRILKRGFSVECFLGHRQRSRQPQLHWRRIPFPASLCRSVCLLLGDPGGDRFSRAVIKSH